MYRSTPTICRGRSYCRQHCFFCTISFPQYYKIQKQNWHRSEIFTAFQLNTKPTSFTLLPKCLLFHRINPHLNSPIPKITKSLTRSSTSKLECLAVSTADMHVTCARVPIKSLLRPQLLYLLLLLLILDQLLPLALVA